MAFLTDGYQTLISFSAFPVFVPQSVKEKEVQPPDLDGMGEIDTTTMRNLRFRTKQPKHLITLGDVKLRVQYDPQAYSEIVDNILNTNAQWTITFPDASTLTFYAWLDKFVPDSLKEGEFPLADIIIHCSNSDNCSNEKAPIFVAGPPCVP